MTDYWVSTKKHYCEICRCWITGSALNIKNHESSSRHISELRKKLIQSHRNMEEQKKQEAFEAAEIERLNTVTLDGPAVVEQNDIAPPIFYGRRVLNPPVDKDKEAVRLKAALDRALSGQPMEDPDATTKTKWISFIDQNDGTLTYYNNETGFKTKIRPKDFDGSLPTSASSLTSNWVLKFDPSKGCKYYHNVNTGEIRWLENRAQSSSTVINRNNSDVSTINQVKTEIDVPQDKQESQIKNKLEQPESISESVSTTVRVKQEYDEEEPSQSALEGSSSINEQPKVKYAAPEIGQWVPVKPEESAFSHSIVSIEPYLEPPPPREPDILHTIRDATYEMPLLNVDDMQVQEKQVYFKTVPNEGEDTSAPVKFAKRRLLKRQ
ncbi:hypothetical protein BBOV_III008510 [Babesia bovis T2Bo]|uniref:hypothetical protein n=1 Tax=Babesia bovis T2Bo TaxID=484906 RepID=UPI001C343D7D|nr:hypothetical protein BBOV_III008510 [Babesia bovis T2Bo]EDO08411.2 hypothetical protein BBOV_III008510 [Babesia bovis T2Bo]